MLEDLREKLDQINFELVDLVKRRTAIVRKIAELKKEKHIPIFQPEREEALKEQIRSLSKQEGVDSALIEDLMDLLIEHSKLEQRNL